MAMSDDYRRASFYLQNGVDVSLSISYPERNLVESADWVEDSAVEKCMLCSKDFGLFNRRHHCRRCGRIFDDACCPKSVLSEIVQGMDRCCIVCSEVLKLNDAELSPSDYDIREYFAEQQLLGAINESDVVLQGEVVRLFQNSLRNNETRKTLMTEWRALFDRVVPLIKTSVDMLVNRDSEPFFKTNKGNLRPEDAQVVLSNCLGLVINFTASSELEYANFLAEGSFRDNNIIDVLLLALNQNLDLVRREEAIWAIRNLTEVKKVALDLSNNEQFKEAIMNLLQCKVRNITESISCIIANLTKARTEFSSEIMSAIPGVCKKNELLTYLLPFLSEGTPTMKGSIIRCLAILCSDPSSREHIQTTPFFSTCLEFILEGDKEIAEEQKAQFEGFVLGGAFLGLSLLFEDSQDDEFCQKLARMVSSSEAAIGVILRHICNAASFSCFGSSLLLKNLATHGFESLYKQLVFHQDLFKASMITVVGDAKTFNNEMVIEHCNAVYQLITANDEESICKGIKHDVKKAAKKKKRVVEQQED